MSPAAWPIRAACYCSGAGPARDFDRGDLACESGQYAVAFHARRYLADALVDAVAKTHMAADTAFDIVVVRPLPLARIAVGGAEEHQHFLALADGHAADLGFARGGAEEGLHRISKRIASSNAARANEGSARSFAN